MDVRMSQQPGARLALELVADKWFVQTVHRLSEHTLRYSELKRAIPHISQRMLTLTLRNMERDGLVTRTVHATVPPQTEYKLTPLGHSLIKPLHTLCLWAEKNIDKVLANRAKCSSVPPRKK